MFLIPETLAPKLLQQKASVQRRTTGNWALHSKLDEEPVEFAAMMRKYGIKPIEMLLCEPILVIVTIYISIIYGKLNVSKSLCLKAVADQRLAQASCTSSSSPFPSATNTIVAWRLECHLYRKSTPSS